jgi:hypothetical protein
MGEGVGGFIRPGATALQSSMTSRGMSRSRDWDLPFSARLSHRMNICRIVDLAFECRQFLEEMAWAWTQNRETVEKQSVWTCESCWLPPSRPYLPHCDDHTCSRYPQPRQNIRYRISGRLDITVLQDCEREQFD